MKAVTRVAVLTAAVGAAHAGPLVTCVLALRKRAFPRLSGLGAPNHVALTFDDGPDAASTPAFLTALDDLGWKATFFMVGRMVQDAPGLAEEVAAAGHEIAVHGHEHRSHLYRSPMEVVADVDRATDIIAAATGRHPRWVRPPYGEVSSGTLVAARRRGLRPVLWTTWGRDWRPEATVASVVADIDGGLGPGGTVLLHDTDRFSAPLSWECTLASLPALADRFAAHGLRPGPLAEHGL